MTARPWMPLYIADYLRDTSHLRALESGAYLHLIMAYWSAGKLPSDDRQLATIAKLTDKEWSRLKPTLAVFFGADFSSHKRIDAELAHTAEVSTKRRAAVEQREIKRRSGDASNDRSNDDTLHTSQRKIDGASAPPEDPKVELFKRGKVVLGPKAGALISKVLKTCGPEDDPKTIAKARAHIETASTKAAPVEWIGRVISQKSTLFEGQIEGII